MSQNRISHAVLIRAYNRPDLLEECLKSLHNQTYKEFSVYICDDSPNNDNEPVIHLYKNKLNIKYFKNKTQLKYSALTFNEILSKVKDEKYVSILDDDDLWDNQRMFEVNKVLLSGKDWVTHYYKFTTNTPLKEYDNVIFKHDKIKSKKDIIPNSSKYFGAPSFHTINVELFKKIGDWDISLKRGPCQEWFTRARMNGYKCFVIKKSLGTYLMNAKSITLTGTQKAFFDEVDTRLKFINKYNSYFNFFKIFITSYSSAKLKNSVIYPLKVNDYKSRLYIIIMNTLIYFKRFYLFK